MTMATVIAGIAIVLDSQILVIGAMVLGPEFVAVAALGLGLVRRRFSLSYLALRTLLVGFFVAIALTASPRWPPAPLGGSSSRTSPGRDRRRHSSTHPTSGRSSWRSSRRPPESCP